MTPTWLAFEAVDESGPSMLRQREELAEALDLLTRVSASRTPSHPEIESVGAITMDEWHTVAGNDSVRAKIQAINPWAGERAEELAALADQWSEVTAGEALLHNDLRTDNMVRLRG